MKVIYVFNGNAPALLEEWQRPIPQKGPKVAWTDEPAPPMIGYVKKGDVTFITGSATEDPSMWICQKEGREEVAVWVEAGQGAGAPPPPVITADLRGNVPDSPTAVAAVTGNTIPLTAVGSKLLSIVNGSVEKAYFDKDGNLLIGGSSVATQNWISSQGYTNEAWVNSQDFAQKSWVNSQGFATQTWVTNQNYATQAWVNGNGFATQSWVNSQGFATQAWVNGQNFATQSWVTTQGYVTPAYLASQGYALLGTAQTFTAKQTFNAGIVSSSLESLSGATLVERGQAADSASAVGVALDNATTLANATAKLVSIRNAGIEKAYFDKDGYLYSGGSLTATQAWITSQGFTTQSWVTSQGYATQAWVTGNNYATQSWVTTQGYATQSWVTSQGYVQLGTAQTFTAKQTFSAGIVASSHDAASGASLTLRGAIADSASAVGVIIDNTPTLANATSKLLSIRNNGTEKAYFDKDGNLYAAGSLVATQTWVSSNYLTQASLDSQGYAKLAPAQTFVGKQTFNGGIATTGNVEVSGLAYNPSGAPISLVGTTVDGAGAVGGAILRANNTLANATAKIVSIQNGMVEKAYFDKDGNLVIGGNQVATQSWVGTQNFATQSWVTGQGYATQAWVNSQNFATQSWVTGQGYATQAWVNGNGYAQLGVAGTFTAQQTFSAGIVGNVHTAAAGSSLTLRGQIADGFAAKSVIIDSGVTLANASTKILSISNNGTEKAYVSLNGDIFAGGYQVATQNWIAGQGYTTQSWVNAQPFARTNSNNTFDYYQYFNGGINTPAIDASGTLSFSSGALDGANARGFYFTSNNWLADPTAYLVRFDNAYNLAAGIRPTGEIVAAQGEVIVGKDGGSNITADFFKAKSPQGATFMGRASDGGAAVIFDNENILNSGYLAAFYNGGYTKAFIDYNGFFMGAGLSPASPNISMAVFGSRSAAATETDVIVSSSVTRTAGKLFAVQNAGVEKLAVGFDGRLIGSAIDVMTFFAGKPANAGNLYRVVFASPVRFPASLTGSKFFLGTNPAATTTLTLKKNGASIGTLSISTSGVFTPTGIAQTDFAVGDRLEVTNQATADTAAADFSLSFLGSRL